MAYRAMSTGNNQSLAVLIACICVIAATARATEIPDEVAAASANLLELNQKVLNGEKISANEVVLAFKDYKQLYAMQTELASSSASDESSQKYKAIVHVLETDGIDNLVETVFQPILTRETIEKREIAKIEAIIKQM